MRRSVTQNILTLCGLPVVIFGLAACGTPDSGNPSGSASSDPATGFQNVSGDVGYVGKEVCGTCHAGQYETYVQSEMGRSFKRAALAKSSADFGNPDPVYDPHNDLYYQPFAVGDDLFVREYRLSGRDTTHTRVERIDYIIGSGHHTNSHIMDVNGYLYQMPVTWYAQDEKWGLAPGFENDNNARFLGPIPAECMTCHNGMPEYVPGSENRFTSVPEGINCERCHGPGELHVEAMRAGRVVNVAEEVDPTIVNPAKLLIDRQFDVCQRCHAQGAAVFADGKTPLDFLPGHRLADVENVYWPRFTDTVRRFTMASHPDRLKMSECFLQSHEENAGTEPLTCITCHNPHVSIKTLGADHYNAVCQSCHLESTLVGAVAEQTVCTADPGLRAASNDNCVSCHMPQSGTEDIPHVRVTDHFIRKVETELPAQLTPDEVAAQREFLGMASLIDPAPTPENIAEGYLTYYEKVTNHPGFLDSAAVLLERADAPLEATLDSRIRVWFLQENFTRITDLARSLPPERIDDAWTAYRVGESYLKTGNASAAVRYLAHAVDLAPQHIRFINRLGVAQHSAGQLNAAIAAFDRVLAANPKYEETWNNRGFSRLMNGDLGGAETDFLEAVKLNPDLVQSIANLASLYMTMGDYEAARDFVGQLVSRDPANPQYRQMQDALARLEASQR